MAIYSIKEIALLSGIKAHTIRIWEKRYNMFTPARTDTNIRRYSDNDLRLALNVSLLQSMGYKISHIAQMSDEEVSTIVNSGNNHISPPAVPEALFIAAINLDKEAYFGKINETIESKGIEWTFENLIVPFQKRMGLLWQSGTISPAQEHFASNILRDLLIEISNRISTKPNGKNKIIFFLPEGETHEIGLLYFNYIAKKEGFATYYLGQNVPIEDVINIANKHNIRLFFTSITMSLEDQKLSSLFTSIYARVDQSVILATGYQVEKYAGVIPAEVHKISASDQLTKELKRLHSV